MNVSFNGYDEKVITFETEESLSNGDLVKVSGDGKVTKCQKGDLPCGVAIAVRGDLVSVQLKGYFELAYSTDESVSLSYGYSNVVADDSNGVKAGSTGVQVMVVMLDTTNSKVGFII